MFLKMKFQNLLLATFFLICTRQLCTKAKTDYYEGLIDGETLKASTYQEKDVRDYQHGNSKPLGSTADEAKVDYYENLIREEIRKTSIYNPPKDAREYQHQNSQPIDYGSVDFVVIGAGTAGSVVAARLSEISTWRILLLEAGQKENDFTEIPSMLSYVANSEYDWGFQTAPQNTCSLSSGGITNYRRGKSLGGSTAINNMMYVRGNKLDYDEWEAEGNPGWSYENVLPYFIKSENASFSGQAGYHGYGGPWTVEYHRPHSNKLDIFLQANQELGYSIVDYNGEQQIGAAKVQHNTIHGSRMSSARAFLEPAKQRSNLEILTKSYVTKILVSNDTKQAYGVLFSRNNIQYLVRVNKEVILSAGAIMSPHILMLSGIGPNDHLKQFNIPVIQNLAVGKNLGDHVAFTDTYVFSDVSEPSFSVNETVEQYLNGIGPLAIAGNLEGLGFYSLDSKTSGNPDIEIVFSPSIDDDEFNSMCMNSRLPNIKNNIFHFFIVLLHPKSRGRIYLKSGDPYDYPIIDSQCLSDSRGKDIEDLVNGFDILLKLLKTKAFEDHLPIILTNPRCSDHQFLSRDYFVCAIRQNMYWIYHALGTCKMGPDPLNGAVVTHDLKVHGIKNLRVADASVVPFPISAHMAAPSIMIGERVADFIKLEHGALFN